jgi:hypothetical protein
VLTPSLSRAAGTKSFEFYSWRLSFRALERFEFPHLLSANIFRGALGLFLSRVDPEAYQTLFEPSLLSNGPSGFATPPRPFVFRCRHLDGRSFEVEDVFTVQLNVFLRDGSVFPALEKAFQTMGATGFGLQRSRAMALPEPELRQLCFCLDPQHQAVQRIRVRFESPTELKVSERVTDRPSFADLFSRVRDRLRLLSSLYGPGPLPVDFPRLNDRAAQIETLSCQLQHVTAERHSSRTDQTHPLGGFTGWAEYAGDLTPFMSYLRIAEWTGVGRQTVWGKGELHAEVIA